MNKLNEIKTMQEDKRNSSSDDEDADFRDINFPQDTALQQVETFISLHHYFTRRELLFTDVFWLPDAANVR